MKRNIIIAVLTIALAVVVFRYEVMFGRNTVAEKEPMKLYKEQPDGCFSVMSEDGKFRMSFIYDSAGLQTFGLEDLLSNKALGFNIIEGVLYSYFYKDDVYDVQTNVRYQDPEMITQREEWCNGILTYYELLQDGTTTTTVKRVETGDSYLEETQTESVNPWYNYLEKL